MKRMLDFVSEQYGKQLTEKQVQIALALISEESKKVFEARWGILDGVYCQTFQQLDEKLKMENSKEEYDRSLEKLMGMLEDFRHVEVFHNCDNIDIAVAGRLWQILSEELLPTN